MEGMGRKEKGKDRGEGKCSEEKNQEICLGALECCREGHGKEKRKENDGQEGNGKEKGRAEEVLLTKSILRRRNVRK